MENKKWRYQCEVFIISCTKYPNTIYSIQDPNESILEQTLDIFKNKLLEFFI